MNISVWDTYVQREDGKVMHFDILVPQEFNEPSKIFDFGNSYLNTKPFKTNKLTTNECQFCHIEQATQEIEAIISDKGYFIIEMQNCI